MCGAQVRLAAGQAGGEEGRAARTHCTWPLAPQASLAIVSTELGRDVWRAGAAGGGAGGRGGGARGAHALHVAAGAASLTRYNGGAGVLRAQRPVPGRARRRLATNDPGSGQRRARVGSRVAAAAARPARLHAGIH
ncbi:uncharacterized protein LOC133534192 isoform X1 [Cydia pomonella]|uniref:uncharacterized protein LOC133534192 isoform X1 n=1 Tax=Cydia pomonella TaxID=82600 RepID=UPI002ADE5D74|nr:uncharacterized protein LOC133534192 isoform X1 [Cydia pomonella]